MTFKIIFKVDRTIFFKLQLPNKICPAALEPGSGKTAPNGAGKIDTTFVSHIECIYPICKTEQENFHKRSVLNLRILYTRTHYETAVAQFRSL